MGVTIEQIKKIIRTNSDAWSAHNRASSLMSDEPTGTFGNLLWQAQRDGQLDLGSLEYFWEDLDGATHPYSGHDIITFLQAVAASRKRTSSNPPGFAGDTPGWHYHFERILTKAMTFDGVSKVLATQWNTLPSPYCDALGYRLARQGAIPVSDLPDSLLQEYAELVVVHQENASTFWEKTPWPDRTWQEALAIAANAEHISRVRGWPTIEGFAPFTTPEQVIGALTKLSGSTNERFPQIQFFVEHAATYIDILELKLINPGSIHTEDNNYDDPAPLMHLSLAYLAMCQKLERIPAPTTHTWFEGFFHEFRVRWSGGRFMDYFRTLNGYLSAFPNEIAAPMILSAPKFPWLLAPSCPTDEILTVIADKFKQDAPSSEYDYKDHANTCIKLIGEPFIPYAAAALVKNKKPLRTYLIMFLANHPNDERAIQALVNALSDSSKGNRESAESGLLDGDPALVMPYLEPQLGARAKATRQAAAHTLLAMGPSAKGYKMAQTQLGKEKVQDIKDILSRVQDLAPQDDTGTEANERITKAIASISETDGKTWKKFEDLGDQFIPTFMKIWEQDAEDSTISFYVFDEDYDTLAKAWLNLLASRHTTSPGEGLEEGLTLLGLMSDSDMDDYVTRLDAIYGATQVGEKFADMLASNRIERPPHCGSCSYSHPKKEAALILLGHYPDHAAPVLPAMLRDKNKSPRQLALAHIAAHPDSLDADVVLPMFKEKRKDLRETAATVLALIGEASHIPALNALVASEKVLSVKKQAELALNQIAARSFDVTTCPLTKAGDVQLDAALATLPHVSLSPALMEVIDKLTRPTWSLGTQPLSQLAFEWLLAEIFCESFERHSELLQVICERLHTEHVHQLCEELITLVARDHIAGWSLFMQSTLASPQRLYLTGARLEEFAKSQSYGWGDHGVLVMERVNTPLTIRILDDWSRKSRRDALKWRASAALGRMANARGIDVDELSEMAIPDFDFDARGERRFDYGARTICVKLGAGDELVYIDESRDKKLKSMPNATSKDDAELVKQARSEISLVKKELRRLRRVQQARFQNAMISGQRWEMKSWHTRYAFNPVMRSFAQGLLWGVFDVATQQLKHAVIVDASADLIDLEDNVITLDESSQKLGVVHPSMLPATQHAAWTQTFADYEIIESFPQLTRDVYARADWPETTHALCTKFKGLNSGTFMGRAERSGWQKGPREDAGLVNSTDRHMGNYVMSLVHDGYSPDYFDDSQLLYVSDVVITNNSGKSVSLADLPDHVFSELVYSLMHLTGGLDEA